MPTTLMLAAGSAVLLLLALLVVQRRRAAAAADAEANDDSATPDAQAAAIDDDRWRTLGLRERIQATLKGGRTGRALLREHGADIRVDRDANAILVRASHEGVYGGRPNWEHIAELTLVMARAERCWPGADLEGVLQYMDQQVPVEYSPRLVADLEDDTAPSPHQATPA